VRTPLSQGVVNTMLVARGGTLDLCTRFSGLSLARRFPRYATACPASSLFGTVAVVAWMMRAAVSDSRRESVRRVVAMRPFSDTFIQSHP